MAGEFEGRERGRGPALRYSFEHLTELKKGIQGAYGRKHRKGADAEESEQQSATNAETVKHRGTP
ncbi:hypothetical protein EME01_52800 [Sinorhizobium meliloti]|nr:hypothetical protein EME01_52800 [Sinorhizobium meliloti]